MIQLSRRIRVLIFSFSKRNQKNNNLNKNLVWLKSQFQQQKKKYASIYIYSLGVLIVNMLLSSTKFHIIKNIKCEFVFSTVQRRSKMYLP